MIPAELFKKIRRIEIRTRGLVDSFFGGEYHSAFKGRGMEFNEVRPYQMGDDIRAIDWNVSARTGETFVKIFQEEREQTVMMAVDISGSENFGTHAKFKREIAAEICAVLAFSAVKNNDKVGLLLFSDQVELFVPPKKGRRHVLRLIRDLFAHEPASSGTNLAVGLDHLIHVLRRRSIVLVISDFLDTTFEKPLRVIAQRHDAIAIHLLDAREEELPAVGLLELADAETGQTVVVDTSSPHVRRMYAQAGKERRANLDALFKKLRLDAIHVLTGEDYIEPLANLFRQRLRRRAR
ncbi:MAG: DUF58 domain-containing protein [Bacteroidota bacterium]